VVAGAVVDLFSRPTTEADVVSQALLGWNVRVLEERDGFARIEGPDRYRGWIERGALLPSAAYATAGEIVAITSPMALLYREPDVTSFAPPLAAPFGARLELAGEGPEGYWRVRAPDGRELFLQTGDGQRGEAASPPLRLTGAELVELARSFLDVPYLWGGMSARGIDCSGLVSVLYRFQGVEILRDADLQFDDPSWVPVERHSLEPGDLVFFGARRDGVARPTHVGLYAGAGRFVSATTYSRPMVREDRLDDPRWAALYLGARRPR
jgi:cell wall-associated NlpC family hydrolase